jgi:hypothetical protein
MAHVITAPLYSTSCTCTRRTALPKTDALSKIPVLPSDQKYYHIPVPVRIYVKDFNTNLNYPGKLDATGIA